MSGEAFEALWNRACQFDSPAISTHEGDAALHVALVFHGSVVNGGLLDAVESYGSDGNYPLPRVLRAYRFLGLDDLAQNIEAARREFEELSGAEHDPARWGQAEDRCNASYPLDDQRLVDAARAGTTRTPGSFAPVG